MIESLGKLEMGDQLAAVRPQILERHRAAGHHRGTHPLTHLVIGDTGDGDVADRGMGTQGLLDLDRPELLSPAVDGVLQPTTRVDVAIGVEACEIACVQPSFGHVGAAVHPQLADGSRFDIDAGVRVDHPDLNAGQRPPHRSHPVGIVVIGWQQGRVGAKGFRLTKHVGERHIRHCGHCRAHQRGGRGRCSVRDGHQ